MAKPKNTPPPEQQPESVNAATGGGKPDQPAGVGMAPAAAAAAQADQAQTLAQIQAQQLATAAQVAQTKGPQSAPQVWPAQPPESANAAASGGPPDQPASLTGGVPIPNNPSTGLPIGGPTGLGSGGSDASDLAALLAAQNAANAATAQQSEQSALLTIEQTLASYGFSGSALQGLVTFAWNEIVNGTSAAQVALDIQNQPAFIQQFPAISERISAGLPPITPAEYLSTLDSYTQTLVAAGINPSEVNLNGLVAQDVSPTELSDRIQQGYMVLSTAAPDVLNALQNYFGIGSGDLVQWATNTGNSEQKILQQVAAAQIGGAATQSGFMGANNSNMQTPVNASLATLLAQQGVTYGQAQSGFANLATQAQLYGNLPGQGQVRNGWTTDQLAQAQFNGGPGEQQLQQQAQREENYFKAGTGVGTSGSQTAVGAFQR